MPQFDENHVKINGCRVVWDGITRPDKNPDGSPKYVLKVVVEPANPDLALFANLANKKLAASKWAGQLPPGGRMPIGTAQPSEFNGLYNGFAVLNCKSQRLPDIYDENGQLLEPMQYGNLLYGGQLVDVLLHCYDYDKAGNQGVAAGIDGFSIMVSAQAPRQNFGSAGVNTSAAFGGGGGGGYDQNQGQQPAQGFQPPQQQQPAYDPNQGQQPAQGGYQQPAQGYQPPAQQQPAQGGYQQPGQGQPTTGPTTYPSNPPQQANNFLPGGPQ